VNLTARPETSREAQSGRVTVTGCVHAYSCRAHPWNPPWSASCAAMAQPDATTGANAIVTLSGWLSASIAGRRAQRLGGLDRRAAGARAMG
jgi:hypothetical protein